MSASLGGTRQDLTDSYGYVGLDNVRNMTGSPIAGIDPHELLDVRPLNYGVSLCTIILCNLPSHLFNCL